MCGCVWVRRLLTNKMQVTVLKLSFKFAPCRLCNLLHQPMPKIAHTVRVTSRYSIILCNHGRLAMQFLPRPLKKLRTS